MGLFASRKTGLRWLGGLEVFWVVWWWFGANMEGKRNKNAFKFILQVFILSQKHILGVKKVVWCGLDVVWGGLGCFGVVWGVSTDRTLPAIAEAPDLVSFKQGLSTLKY